MPGGGQFAVDSHPNRGTKITIRLKIEPSPSWFVSKLQLHPGSKVIVFDDDQSIHQIWDERLKLKSTFSRDLEILHFSSASEVRRFYSRNFQDMAEDMFLMDHEILGSSETGLDLIESLGISKQAILVTSHYENPDLRLRCKRLNVRMIPKPMSGFVPVEILALGLRDTCKSETSGRFIPLDAC